jgi:hypothetical protein
MPTPTNKPHLYCYVDESGQDTYGKFFIVSVVVTGDMRERLVLRLEQIEHASRKGKAKWTAARQSERLAYMKAVIADPIFNQTLHFAFYQNTVAYTTLTILSTARAILSVPDRGTAAVYIDGLPKSRVRWFGTELRRLSVRVNKVVGIRREESDALIRLADACCGFVRQALTGTDEEMKTLFERAKRNDYLKEV